MEINKENNKVDTVNFSLRYLFEDETIAGRFMCEIQQSLIDYEHSKPSKRSKYYVFLIDLENVRFDIKKMLLINEKLSLKDCFGFWFDIASDFQMGGFTVPEYIVGYQRILGGSLDFSYIINLD